jgi:hypothetical protein
VLVKKRLFCWFTLGIISFALGVGSQILNAQSTCPPFFDVIGGLGDPPYYGDFTLTASGPGTIHQFSTSTSATVPLDPIRQNRFLALSFVGNTSVNDVFVSTDGRTRFTLSGSQTVNTGGITLSIGCTAYSIDGILNGIVNVQETETENGTTVSGPYSFVAVGPGPPGSGSQFLLQGLPPPSTPDSRGMVALKGDLSFSAPPVDFIVTGFPWNTAPTANWSVHWCFNRGTTCSQFQPFTFVTSSLPVGAVGLPYKATLIAQGGYALKTGSTGFAFFNTPAAVGSGRICSVAFPCPLGDGLTLLGVGGIDPTTRVEIVPSVSGTPTALGQISVAIVASDSVTSICKVFTIKVCDNTGSCGLQGPPASCGSSGTDTVRLSNTSGDENGILVNGLTSGLQWEHEAFRSVTSPIGLGSNLTSSPAANGNEVVTYATDHTPLVNENVPWTASPDTVPADLGLLFPVRLKIWIVYTDTIFTSTVQRQRVAADIVRANSLLRQERAGLVLDAVGSDIQDVSHTRAAAAFANFTCAKKTQLQSAIGKAPGVINVYYVGTINSDGTRGTVCSNVTKDLGDNFAAISKFGDHESLLHEIGHDFSLQHVGSPVLTNGQFQYQNCAAGGQFDSLNLMCTGATGRQYFSEGQTFRTMYNPGSALNFVYNRLAQIQQRHCGPADESLLCPTLSKRIWDDGSLKATLHQ